ncbi:hypothetical protein ACS3UN_10090 [Oscillospiraceae bacterium LTW-04]|nr:hypothetical protein RBH76_11840 [Oscillospiraceae bacterium MB24-C1]WMJ84458.1 hypothetical protein RBH76_03260 [Oscillospiraceae bacterium MB24-C1]
MQTMYPAFVNSPETVTLGAISPTDTTVTVQDITKIPVPPNLLVIGGDRPDAETVLLTAVSGSTLTIQRAVNGTARTWADRTTIARNFTAYDHDAFKANIEKLNTGKLNTDGNGSNVTADFTQASSKLNISSGEKLSVIFGKLMKWYASFGAAAWMCTGTTSGTVALGNHNHTAAAVGAVPTTRKVNGKALSADVTLTAPDVDARPNDWLPTTGEIGAAPDFMRSSRTIYVATTGSDITGDGTSANPYATISKAVSMLTPVSAGNYNTTINIATGTYTENILIANISNVVTLSPSGSTTINGTLTISGAQIVLGNNLTINATSASAILVNVNRGGTFNLDNKTLILTNTSGLSGVIGVLAELGGNMNTAVASGTISITDMTNAAIAANGTGRVYANTIMGNGNGIGIRAWGGIITYGTLQSGFSTTEVSKTRGGQAYTG